MHFNDGRVVSNFVVQALENKPITLYGDGAQTRSFCFVSDLIEGFIRLMKSDLDATPVNLGNPQERTIKELAQQVVALTGSRSELIYTALPVDDPVRRKPLIGIAQEQLGWEPRVSLEQGLTATIADFRKRLALG
jgi:UDP-glucuronate decarboxylase